MNIREIKRYLRYKVGSNVVIVYYGSRNKKEKYKGVVYKTYDNVFTIKVDEDIIKCFSYNDILTKTVQIYI
jgi:uncharacterized protein Veg